MVRPVRAVLASIAFLTALTALSHFSCSVVPEGFPQDWNVSSHENDLLVLVAISVLLLDSPENAEQSSGVGGGSRTLNEMKRPTFKG